MAGIKPDQFWVYKRDTSVLYIPQRSVQQAQKKEAHGMSWNAMEPWTLDGNQCSCDVIPHDSNLNIKRSRDLIR